MSKDWFCPACKKELSDMYISCTMKCMVCDHKVKRVVVEDKYHSIHKAEKLAKVFLEANHSYESSKDTIAIKEALYL